ncbi:MFS transporter [Yinghuangia sp. ASG 101]|uniref:MFS transporter n=1 Tax=Yinghuangia sp. ASG 101 TaxID=2896848 RepID=UPI001E554E9F|nr:MFS transporter [Yinghuangia sp. ASG 101]UGQ15299.1 MFS transporter [Yinghuangia sp. ASG 101]
MVSVLRDRVYRRLFAAQVIALLGTGLATVALGLLAYDMAGGGAGAVLGTALAIKMAAYVLVAPVVGAVAERLPRRALMVGADAVRAGVALALPFVGQVWQIYVLVFLLQSASAAFTPTFQAVIPDVLRDEGDYTRALSLSRLAYDLESLVSPALAAALLAVTTYNRLFLGTVVGFAASGLLVLSAALPARAAPPPREGGVYGKATSGARILLATPGLRALSVLNLAVAAASAMVVVNSVVYVRDDLGRSEGDVAFALGAYGAGSMLVALWLPRVLRSAARDRTVMLCGARLLPAVFAALGVLTLAPPASWRWPGLLAAWAAFGAAASMVLTPTGRLIRRSVAERDRTRVFAAQFSLSHACWLVTYPLAGGLGAAAGRAWAVGALGVIALVAATAASWWWPAPERRPSASAGCSGADAVRGAGEPAATA